VEDEEALETGAVVGETTNLLEDVVDELLADGIVTTGVFMSAMQSKHRFTVVGGVLLAGDHSLRVEEAAVGAGADLVNHVRLEVDLGLAKTR
jgi:hypothetical protein